MATRTTRRTTGGVLLLMGGLMAIAALLDLLRNTEEGYSLAFWLPGILALAFFAGGIYALANSRGGRPHRRQ